jgi:ribosomal protein S18 acetylase RimI-like enzyme
MAGILAGRDPYPAAMSEVAELEAVCERAWPPQERLELDGAVLRFTHGFTRRANSARVDAGGGDLEGLIARAEEEYRSRGLRPGFRLTPLTPPAFEALLRERGYEVDTEAVVMVAGALPETAAPDPGDGIELSGRLGEEWLRVFQAIERRWPAEQDAGARWVLGSGDAPRRFALARVDGEPAATGYGRIEGDWLYIASVATFPKRRRLGLARAVSDRLVAWAAEEGARRAILQAETKNGAAQALYAALGFEPRYIYRDFVPARPSATD